MSVLVIEDDEGVSESLADVLADEGYSVEIAHSGRDALRRLAGDPLPSLILLDLMMPEMDGIDFRRAQLADARLRAIPVVIVSARPDVAACAAALHADDYLR